MSMNCMIITADSGYGCIGLIKGRISRGVDGIMVMPEQPLRSHPLVGTSHINPSALDDDVH